MKLDKPCLAVTPRTGLTKCSPLAVWHSARWLCVLHGHRASASRHLRLLLCPAVCCDSTPTPWGNTAAARVTELAAYGFPSGYFMFPTPSTSFSKKKKCHQTVKTGQWDARNLRLMWCLWVTPTNRKCTITESVPNILLQPAPQTAGIAWLNLCWIYRSATRRLIYCQYSHALCQHSFAETSVNYLISS